MNHTTNETNGTAVQAPTKLGDMLSSMRTETVREFEGVIRAERLKREDLVKGEARKEAPNAPEAFVVTGHCQYDDFQPNTVADLLCDAIGASRVGDSASTVDAIIGIADDLSVYEEASKSGDVNDDILGMSLFRIENRIRITAEVQTRLERAHRETVRGLRARIAELEARVQPQATAPESQASIQRIVRSAVDDIRGIAGEIRVCTESLRGEFLRHDQEDERATLSSLDDCAFAIESYAEDLEPIVHGAVAGPTAAPEVEASANRKSASPREKSEPRLKVVRAAPAKKARG